MSEARKPKYKLYASIESTILGVRVADSEFVGKAQCGCIYHAEPASLEGGFDGLC